MNIERPFPIDEQHKAGGDEEFFNLPGPKNDAERAVVDAIVERLRTQQLGANRRRRIPRQTDPAPKA